MHVASSHYLFSMAQLLGYCDEILDLRFLGSGDAARMVVATNSEHVKIFQRRSLDCQVLHGHSRVVLALDSCSPAPPLPPLLLVTSSKDHTLRVWAEVEVGGAKGSEFVCQGVGSGHTQAVGAVALARCVQHTECRGFESHPRQLIFFGKVTALDVLCCFALLFV